ncbi:hypothetical protein [Leptotrichia sp. oral taxon 879]|uniref:DUF304 domain-containing protein n=1 Tax=Leptotrichia mesophila TaxID=3239303 RepID=A0AB39V8C9_9FUSO|nr:hypothetical protein [Leptotrichia sp. oral taxon 879]ERK48434.1 hypothetical protein HMPREF1552_02063 [Leptotrichia sp. oral taxon 879 str. F0557]
MNKLNNTENLKNKLENLKIEDEKNKYIFRANLRYMISSSIFFMVIAFIAAYSLYKGIIGAEKLTIIRIAFIVIIFVYVIIASILLFEFKIVIENDEIVMKKVRIKMKNIESASLRIIRVGMGKADKFLEIITTDKKRIQMRMNISDELLFLKLIQNQIGEKLDI